VQAVVVLFESGDYNIFTLHQGGFAGWIGDAKIAAFQFYDNDYCSPVNMYGTIDGIYTGFSASAPIPEPAESAGIAALGALTVVGLVRPSDQPSSGRAAGGPADLPPSWRGRVGEGKRAIAACRRLM